jgi:hypothetical protein
MWTLWRWLPPAQRRRLLFLAARQGETLVRRELRRRKRR